MRDRYLAFIACHEAAWELVFAALAVVFVIVGFVDETPLVFGIELALTIVFVAESRPGWPRRMTEGPASAATGSISSRIS